MKRIGITQKVHEVAEHHETRDSLDHNWAELLCQLGYLLVPLSNYAKFAKHYIDQLALDGIILSGGEDVGTVNVRDAFEKQLITAALSQQIPLLGVCRGFQLLNIYFKGSVQPIEGHVAVRHDIYPTKMNSKFFPETELNVNSYHHNGIQLDALAANLQALFLDDDSRVESAIDEKKNVAGIMWHPEREKPFIEFDIHFIKKFFG